MDTFNLRKFLKENKLKEFDDGSIEQYGDAMKQALGDGEDIKEDRFEDIEHIFSGEPEPGTEQEAPAHIITLAIAAEDAYEEMGNIDEVLKFVEMHLKGMYGE